MFTRTVNSETTIYDTDNRLTGKTVGGVGAYAYAYDNVGRQTTITDPQSKVTTFAFDADGRQTLASMPNGVATSTAYAAVDHIRQRNQHQRLRHKQVYQLPLKVFGD